MYMFCLVKTCAQIFRCHITKQNVYIMIQCGHLILPVFQMTTRYRELFSRLKEPKVPSSARYNDLTGVIYMLQLWTKLQYKCAVCTYKMGSVSLKWYICIIWNLVSVTEMGYLHQNKIHLFLSGLIQYTRDACSLMYHSIRLATFVYVEILELVKVTLVGTVKLVKTCRWLCWCSYRGLPKKYT